MSLLKNLVKRQQPTRPAYLGPPRDLRGDRSEFDPPCQACVAQGPFVYILCEHPNAVETDPPRPAPLESCATPADRDREFDRALVWARCDREYAAEHLGCSSATVSNWIRASGKTCYPKPRAVRTIARRNGADK